jgi:S1-C subfamily serine protease
MHRARASLLCVIVAAGLLGGKAAGGARDDFALFPIRLPADEAEAASSEASLTRREGNAESGGRFFRSGTAFFVTQAGDMLTSAHVVRGCEHIEIWPGEDSSMLASLESIDPRLDVALLATHHGVSRVAILRAGPLPKNSSVFTIGFGLTPSTPLEPVITRSRAEGTVRVKGHRLLVLHATLYQGNSGGPVIDERGLLVGMVVGRYVDRPDLSVAVRASELARFLGTTRSRLMASMNRSSKEDPGKNLREISALVQCVQ